MCSVGVTGHCLLSLFAGYSLLFKWLRSAAFLGGKVLTQLLEPRSSSLPTSHAADPEIS